MILEGDLRPDGHAPPERGEWRGDFAWAREQSFRMASPDVDWFVWADADDVIENGGALRTIAADAPADVDVVVCSYDDGIDDHGEPRIRTWRERLVRAGAGLTWSGVVHEYLKVPDGERRGARRIEPDQLRWIHRPLVEPDPGRNLRLLRAEAARAESGGYAVDPRTLFYLGLESFWFGDFAVAEPLLRRWVEDHGNDGDDTLAATNRLAACYRLGGRLADAIALEREAFERRPDWLPTAVGLTQTYAAAKDWAKAAEWGRAAMRLEPPHTGVSIPYLEVMLVPRLRLAEAALELGSPDEAMQAFRAATEAAPGSTLLAEQGRQFEALVDGDATREALRLVRMAIAGFDETMRAALRGLTVAAGRGEEARGVRVPT